MVERRHAVLIVDDEPDILDSLQLSLELDYEVLTADNGADGLALLKEHEVALIISDQRMPKMTGVEFLAQSMDLAPKAVRMMLTGFSDYDAIVEAINKGHIYRYIAKPWEPRDLELDVKRAVESFAMQTSLDRRMRELAALCEIGATITSDLDMNRTVQKILDSVVDTLGFDRTLLFLVDEVDRVLRYRGGAGVPEDAVSFVSRMEYDLNRRDVAVVMTVNENRPILVEDIEDTEIQIDQEAARRIGIRSFVAVPLRGGGRQIGALIADRSGAGERVTEHDQRLLMGFADQASIAIENARLYEEAVEKQRLEEEVSIAAEIQRHLLPAELPVVDGIDLAGMSEPCRWVSGDYYDAFVDDNDRLWFALGDVTGKGVPAALTMATLRTLFRMEAERAQSLSEMMHRVSEGLFLATLPEVFATFFVGVIDPSTRGLSYVNAGHPYPVLAGKNGTARELEGAGIPAGMDPLLTRSAPYAEQQVELAPGDVVVIFSDGVSEAGAFEGNMFGEERIASVVSEHFSEGAQGVQQAVFRAVTAFMGGMPLDDDLTLVTVGVRN